MSGRRLCSGTPVAALIRFANAADGDRFPDRISLA
jgi:hypothetical protein